MDEEEKRTHFWQALAGLAFALWAVLVPISAKWVVVSLDTMSKAQMVFAQESAKRNELLEGRITRIEERQRFIMEELKQMKYEHDVMGHGPVKNR